MSGRSPNIQQLNAVISNPVNKECERRASKHPEPVKMETLPTALAVYVREEEIPGTDGLVFHLGEAGGHTKPSKGGCASRVDRSRAERAREREVDTSKAGVQKPANQRPAEG